MRHESTQIAPFIDILGSVHDCSSAARVHGHAILAWKAKLLYEVHAVLFGASQGDGVERSQNFPRDRARGYARRRRAPPRPNPANNGTPPPSAGERSRSDSLP